MDKNIRIAQYMDQRMVSPVEESFMTIDGTTYATGKDGGALQAGSKGEGLFLKRGCSNQREVRAEEKPDR